MKYALALFALTGALAAPSERRQENGAGELVPSTIQLKGSNLCVHASSILGEYKNSANLQPCQVSPGVNSERGAKEAPDQGWISIGGGTELAAYPGYCLSATGDGWGALAACGEENDDIRTTNIYFDGKSLCISEHECFAAQKYEFDGDLFLTLDKSIWAEFDFPYLAE